LGGLGPEVELGLDHRQEFAGASTRARAGPLYLARDHFGPRRIHARAGGTMVLILGTMVRTA
jgi:hypothetical protein